MSTVGRDSQVSAPLRRSATSLRIYGRKPEPVESQRERILLSIVLGCNHELKFEKAYQPKKGDVMWCARCREYDTVAVGK